MQKKIQGKLINIISLTENKEFPIYIDINYDGKTIRGKYLYVFKINDIFVPLNLLPNKMVEMVIDDKPKQKYFEYDDSEPYEILNLKALKDEKRET